MDQRQEQTITINMPNKIDINKLVLKDGLEYKDHLRDGHSSDLDSLKVGALLSYLVTGYNEMVDELAELKLKHEVTGRRGRKPKYS